MNIRVSLIRRFLLATTALMGLVTISGHAQPANDMFANRIVIVGTNVVVTGNNVAATRETGEPYHAGNRGGASVWWSWQATTNGVATISTYGSSFDTILGVYTGSSVSQLTTIASNDDDPDGGLTSAVAFDVTPNQVYQIAVDGYDGDSGDVTLSVQLAPPAPPIPPSPAPAWQLRDPYGNMVYSTNFAGKVVIVDFWATWCSPCKAEMPDLVALQSKYRADGLVIVGADVSWSAENAQTVADFLTTFTPTVNYQVVMSDAATDNTFGNIAAIPTTFIIDRQNLIRKTYVGTQSFSTLENQIIPLLYDNTRLAWQPNGTQMTLSWPANALLFTLQSANDLANPAWSDWPTDPTVLNGTNTVQVPLTTPRYFRLHLAY